MPNRECSWNSDRGQSGVLANVVATALRWGVRREASVEPPKIAAAASTVGPSAPLQRSAAARPSRIRSRSEHRSMIAQLFPESVHTVTATADANLPPLLPQEERCIRRAVEKRRREFAAGRACARKALEYFGISSCPLLVGPTRAPIWPDDIVGSITHCEGFVGVAVARRDRIRGLGVDAERADPLDPELVELICSPRERDWIHTDAPRDSTAWPKLFFSAKEAAYKCLSAFCERPLGFHDLEIAVHPSEGRFAIRISSDAPVAHVDSRHLEGRFATSSRHVFTGVFFTAR